MSHGADDYPIPRPPLSEDVRQGLNISIINSKESLRRYAKAWMRADKHVFDLEDGFLDRAKTDLITGIRDRLPFGTKLYLHYFGGVLDPPQTVSSRFVITADQQSTTYQLILERKDGQVTLKEI